MCGRCKSCNSVLFEEEMAQKIPGTNEYTDLCARCLDIALNPDQVDDTYHTKNYYNEEE